MKASQIATLALAWTAVFPWLGVGGVPFTLNGYDVDGGTQPICWTLPLANFSTITEFQPDKFQMMAACSMTTLKVTPRGPFFDDEVTRAMYTGVPYTFEVEFSVDYATIDTVAPEKYFLFRILFCDISKIGFCNPIALNFLDYNATEYTPAVVEEFYDSLDNGTLGYREGTIVKAVRIGNHIYSRWINLTMDEINPRTQRFRRSVNITLQMPAGQAGTFFGIGHAHVGVYLNDENATGAGLYVETADAIPDHVVNIVPPPRVLEVSTGMKIGLGAVSGIFSLGSLILLIFIVYNREHMVMKLSQWGMLSWLVSCALISFVFVFTYMPTQKWHCRLAEFFEIVPMTMIGAIMVGRIWRVYMTLSQALSIGTDKEKEKGYRVKRLIIGALTQIARFPYGLREIGQHDKGFRQKTTSMETTRLILWLCSPQIILQVVAVLVYGKSLDVEFDVNLTEGRTVCDDEGMWARQVGVVLVWGVYTLAIVLAWVGKHLPSAFNETDGIFQSSSINAIVALIAICLDLLTSKVRTHPDVTVFVWASASIILCSTSVGFIVIPKVRRVLSGEKVIISNLLSQARYSQHASVPGGRRPTLSSGPAQSGEREPISLKRNEPIPRRLEREIIGVNEMMQEIRDELVDGRTPTLREWQRLIEKVDDLHEDLNQIHFDWTEEEER